MFRKYLIEVSLSEIRKLLTLQDRNPHSPTYGCFDRNYWHYKIIDFPSGMAQEFIYPMALATTVNEPGNIFHQNATIREWVRAGIAFAAQSAHADGSCDDYFPFEKAGGAAAFSLLAALESYRILALDDPGLLIFLKLRGAWLAHHHESGRLSNHQALIALCMHRLAQLTGDARWGKAREVRLQKLLGWQHEEGWFPEYEGCDPGYLTLTLGCLAQINADIKTPLLEKAIRRGVEFVSEFVHPDGSFGGEYTSRNTYNYFPHAFEIIGKWMPEALRVNDGFLSGLQHGKGACYTDDHVLAHHLWSNLLAAKYWVAGRPPAQPRKRGRIHFHGAGLLIERRGSSELYIALNKGGTFKFFRNGEIVVSDTQISLRCKFGAGLRSAVAHLVDDYETSIETDGIRIAGTMGWEKHKGMTPFRLIALRLLMIFMGRFNPDLVRRFLQKILITGKTDAPFRFERTLQWQDDALQVEDAIDADSWDAVVSAGIGASQTSIYVVMSRMFQESQLQQWHDLTSEVRSLKSGKELKVTRRI